MEKGRYVRARLRQNFDGDLIEALDKLNPENESELIRTGLRWVLGITTQKVTEVRNLPVRPILLPKVFIGQQKM